MGKTLWARSIGDHAYFHSLFNMDNIAKEVEYAVFDDMQGGFQFVNYKAWIGAQGHFTVTGKYKRHVEVDWGKPVIWLMNTDPRLAPGVDVDWLEGNADILYIGEPLAWIS